MPIQLSYVCLYLVGNINPPVMLRVKLTRFKVFVVFIFK